MFAQIRAGDLLVHHPYESFTASVERFIAQAADDPDVLTIKQTLYRTSGDSPIVQNLIRAAERGKQVVVLVEIKARFDEEANIVWARRLEQAGAHVVYGLVGLKTHSKVALVVRREGIGLRRYVHIGTGNYNSKTARSYVDIGLLSCREELGADVTDLFNSLTGLSRQRVFRRLIVAPTSLRSRFLELVEREATNARAGTPARIVIKINSLVDTQMVEALYEASAAGVEIDCIIRGACCLVPGVEGLSEHIRVRSVIGEFLEHSRIWMFANGGRAEWYIGSADLMERNLDRRVEVVTPVEDQEAQSRLARIIDVHAGRQPALVAARSGRQLAADRDPRVRRGHHRHLRRAQGGRRAVGRRHGSFPPLWRRGRRIDGSTRVTGLLERRPMEVELKYRMTDVATGERLLATDELAGFAATGPAETVRHEDRYLDTEDGALEAAGYSGRLRSTGKGTILTLKGLARHDNGGSTHRREELEGPADPAQPPAAWPASEARDAVVRDRRRARAASTSSRSARSARSGTTRATAPWSRCPSTTSRSSSVRRSPSGSPSWSSSCGTATR